MNFSPSSRSRIDLARFGTAAMLVPSLVYSAGAEVITLVGGDVINVQIIEEHDDHIVVEHPALGRIEISRERIASIVRNSDGQIEDSQVAESADEAEASSAADADDTPGDTETTNEKSGWKSCFTLGGAGSFGNTDSQNLTISISSVRETLDQVAKIDLGYFLDLTDGDRNNNRFTAGVRHDWLLSETKWLHFVQNRFDYDEFQSWEYRLGGHVGVGYRYIDEDDLKITPRFGVGGSKEWKSENNEFRPELLLGVTLDWTISEKQSISADSTVYPDLDDTGEFRAVSNLSWSLLVDEETIMSLPAGLFHEYQSDVDADVDKNDVRVFVGLKFVF